MNDIILKDKNFYNITDIQKILGVGRSRAYEYIREVEKNGEPFKVIRIGSVYKIPVLSFNKWIEELSK